MTDPTTPEGRAELRQMLAKATRPGPWAYSEDEDGDTSIYWAPNSSRLLHDLSTWDGAEVDAELAVAAVNALPALLDALDQAEQRADSWAESAADGFGVKSLNVDDGKLDLKMVANNDDAERIMLAMSDAMGQMLETRDAPNYVEFDVAKRGRSRYTVTVRKSVKPTPHQLRQQAEDRAEKAEAALAEKVEVIGELIHTRASAWAALDRVRQLAEEFRGYGVPIQPWHAADRISAALDGDS